MTRTEIAERLTGNHESFIQYLNTLSREEFLFAPADKWNAGQQLQHIILSVKPVATAFNLPSFALKMLFGKSNRPGRDYSMLVEKYKSKLNEGGKAPGRFVPEKISFEERGTVSETLRSLIGKLNHRMMKMSERNLDELILPHPLLGKLTLKEMMFFTIYHVEHHREITQRNLKEMNILLA